ncbi:hypothetical protein AD928_00695 [Acetobacter cerevisiae]|uniref:Uncharacterized protein n=1 Tax=Acetobacter cerevisiae TaxID=178900 RepID=A0A149QZX8_9PROT|nr:hypothetical protein AD928_00695 [Acetobacter cerevisiae]
MMAFGIQRQGNGFRGFAVSIVPKDPSDDIGLFDIDRAFATDRLATGIALPDNVVPVAQATAGLPLFDTTAQAASGFVGQFLEVECIHRASEADVKRGDLAAFRERDDLYSREGHALEQAGNIFLIAG